MKLEIGCGKKPRPGYRTCDVRALPNVDYVCTADNLPFENNFIIRVCSKKESLFFLW